MLIDRKFILEPSHTTHAWMRNLGTILGLSTLVLSAWIWFAFFAMAVHPVDPYGHGGGCPYDEEPGFAATNPEADKALLGLWNFVPELPEGHPPAPSDLVRFYYFHEGGIGLYRYGRQGFNNTHSFDWQRNGNELWLKFRKTGITHQIPFRLHEDGEELDLQDDPREMGRAKYRRARGPVDAQLEFWPARAMQNLERPTQDKPSLDGSMWISVEHYETGGMAFSMYQFAPAALDGRGVGWHHRGDFDNWSTESLEYRMAQNRLELKFERNQESHQTPFWMERHEHTELLLHSDPRNWWQRSSFVRMGRSF